jgi:hypothetical protein
MFLFEFREKHLGKRGGSGRIESHVQQAVGVRIDTSVQSVSPVVELNHGLVDVVVIRA